ILEVMGALRGRVRPDGSIDVRLGATRWVDAEKAGTPRRGGIGGGGTKVFSVLAGETVSMVLPAPGGRNGVSVTTTVKTQGAEVKSDSTEVWVDNKEFFAGHQDELILTVTRER
ncbi:MAG: hypothetical protein R3344_02560, partial [Acidobacteriota bacterium]|nr:hypothetical protein [Acidobacteriota bacterium]